MCRLYWNWCCDMMKRDDVMILSVRSTTQFVPPLQIDWYGPSRPSTLYMVSTQSNFMTSTSSNSQSGVQRFFQEFRLPDYTLDSFSGRLLDVVSSTTFSSGDVQVELCHAVYVFETKEIKVSFSFFFI